MQLRSATTQPSARPTARRPLLSRPTTRTNAVPLRVSLGGVRLPLALLIITAISRVHQYIGLLNKARPGVVLFIWVFAALGLGTKNALAKENWKELPIRLIIALCGAALLSMPFGI